MEVLSPLQLKRLETHKYNSRGISLTEPYLQVYWRWLVELFPMWIAPNMITIIGLGINIATAFLMMLYCPTATETAPGWVYFLNGVGLFIYQSLDAIDGKQARRTGNSSPLGELFDHGCDSISTVFVVLAICCSLQLGHHMWIFTYMCLSSYFAFYFSHWCSYVTGVLEFGKIDVTELQLYTIILFFVTGYFGPSVWSTILPVVGFPLHIFPVLFVAVGTTLTYYRFASLIFKGGCGENGATIADTSVISPFFNIMTIIVFAVSIASQSKTMLCQNHPVLFLLFFGIVSAKATNRLVVAHMTRSELQLLDTSLLGPLFLFLNQYFGCFINEYFLLWICFIHSSVDLLQYLMHTYKQIANHLKIYIFTIIPKQGEVPKEK